MHTLLKDLFQQSIDFLSQHEVFYGHGVAMAEDEVVLLLMHVLKVDFMALNQLAETIVADAEVERVKSLLKQRVEKKTPMAYLVGFSIFAGLQFEVDERVLIPRSPFVELIDTGFAPWIDLNQPRRVVDLCTGSGCIGLAIAHYFKKTQVVLLDLSEDALVLAQENTRSLQLDHRVSCIQSDLFEHLEGCYDLIVTNPPYVADDEYQDLPAEFSHEPKMALVSDQQGMEIPVRILLEAPEYMTDEGYLFLEVGYNDEVLSACLSDVPIEWIDLTLGGQGICVFNRHDLLKYRPEFKDFLTTHVT